MHTMPPGTYYVGDLCYVLVNQWDDVCKLLIEGENVKQGSFTLPNGTQFAIFNTAYGDGIYRDEIGNEYGVDSGSIGCVKIDNISPEILERIKNYSAVVNFPSGLSCYEVDGVIHLGDITIDTND